MTSREELIEEAAKAMAILDDYDGCFERLAGTDPEEPLSTDEEDAEFWRKRARVALAVFEQAHTPTDDERVSLMDAATDAFAKHEGAPTWQDDPVGRDAALRWHMRGFEDGLNARRTVQGEPTDAYVTVLASEFEREWDNRVAEFDPEVHDESGFIWEIMRAALCAAAETTNRENGSNR